MYRAAAALILALLVIYLVVFQRTSSVQLDRSSIGTGVKPVDTRTRSDKDKDGLVGLVQTVHLSEPRFLKRGNEYLAVTAPTVRVQSTTYDSRGNKIEEVFYDLNDPPKIYKSVYDYDDEGKRITEMKHDANAMLDFRKIFTYDLNRQLVKIEEYSSDGILKNYELFTYNDDARLMEEKLYYGDGSLLSYWTNSYDDQRTRTRVAHNNHENYKEVVTYDSVGNIASTTRYDFRGKRVYQNRATYDDNGNLIQSTQYDETGNPTSNVVNTYDIRRNVAETTFYTGKSITSRARIAYLYDSHANWIRATPSEGIARTSKQSSKPDVVRYRTITYYPE